MHANIYDTNMNLTKKGQAIKAGINNINFIGCEDILVGDVLHYHIIALNDVGNFKSRIKNFFAVITRFFFDIYDFSIKGRGVTLFLFSASYGKRLEMRKAFNKIKNLNEDHLSMEFSRYRFAFNMKKVKCISLFFQWQREMRRARLGLNHVQCSYLTRQLFWVYMDYLEYKKFIENNDVKSKNAVVWCDVHTTDCFFVQKYNLRKNSITITLQHGSISGKINSWAAKGPKSKFYFAYNEFTKNTLKSSGYDGKVKICGSAYRLEHVQQRKKFCRNVLRIGVLLNAEELHESNLRILQFLKEFSISHDADYEIDLKFHPSSNSSLYDKSLLEFANEIFEGDVAATQFIDTIDIGIMNFSSTFIDLLDARVPVLVFQKREGLKFPVTGIEKIVFQSQKQLEKLIDDINNELFEDYYWSLFRYYGSPDDTDKLYYEAFKELLG